MAVEPNRKVGKYEGFSNNTTNLVQMALADLKRQENICFEVKHPEVTENLATVLEHDRINVYLTNILMGMQDPDVYMHCLRTSIMAGELALKFEVLSKACVEVQEMLAAAVLHGYDRQVKAASEMPEEEKRIDYRPRPKVDLSPVGKVYPVALEIASVNPSPNGEIQIKKQILEIADLTDLVCKSASRPGEPPEVVAKMIKQRYSNHPVAEHVIYNCLMIV